MKCHDDSRSDIIIFDAEADKFQWILDMKCLVSYYVSTSNL